MQYIGWNPESKGLRDLGLDSSGLRWREPDGFRLECRNLSSSSPGRSELSGSRLERREFCSSKDNIQGARRLQSGMKRETSAVPERAL